MAAVAGVALRPGGRPGAASGVSSAVLLGLRVLVAAGVGVPLRPGGRPGAAVGVSPAVTLGLRVPVAAGVGVAPTALAAVGAPYKAVAAGSSTAATVALTGRRTRAVLPRAGTASQSSVDTVPGVVEGASAAAAGFGRQPGTEFGTGRVGAVVMPFLGQELVVCQHYCLLSLGTGPSSSHKWVSRSREQVGQDLIQSRPSSNPFRKNKPNFRIFRVFPVAIHLRSPRGSPTTTAISIYLWY